MVSSSKNMFTLVCSKIFGVGSLRTEQLRNATKSQQLPANLSRVRHDFPKIERGALETLLVQKHVYIDVFRNFSFWAGAHRLPEPMAPLFSAFPQIYAELASILSKTVKINNVKMSTFQPPSRPKSNKFKNSSKFYPESTFQPSSYPKPRATKPNCT